MILSSSEDNAATGMIEGAQLSLEGVTKSFDKVTAVCDLSLRVNKGEFLSLLGPSGSGKTTVLRLIAGLEEPDRGRIALWGRILADREMGIWVPPERRGIGVVFQDYALFPHMTALQNVAFGLKGHRRRERMRQAKELLERAGLSKLAGRYPHELSGGEQQRVALARALAPGPAVLLLDEPFSSLDKNLRVRLRVDVKEILTSAGMTVVFVTHDQEEAFFMGDRIAVLNRGQMEQLGTPQEIYFSPATRFVAEFTGGDLLPGLVRDGKVVTEAGAFPAQGLPEGEEVEVLLRPEMVKLHGLGGGGEEEKRGPKGVLISSEIRGSEIIHLIELPSGRRLYSRSATVDGCRIRPGETVLLQVLGRPLIFCRGRRWG